MAKSTPRRLIKFGNSSFVISIPKEWIERNNLKKGDLIFLQEGDMNEMILFPKEKKVFSDNKTLDIDVSDKNNDDLRREITSAYINNFNLINIKGKDLKQRMNQLKEIIQPLTGLEILEQSPKEIIIKDFLDVDTISPKKMIRRIDNTIREIFEELKIAMKEKNTIKNEVVDEIIAGDKSINKLYFLVLKLVKIGTNNKDIMKSFGMNYDELSAVQGFAMNLEYIGDDLKRIARFLTKVKLSDRQKYHFDNTFSSIEKSFIDIMTAYHQGQPVLAREVLGRKHSIIKEIEKFCESGNNVLIGNISERLKIVYSSVYNLAKIMIY